MDTLYPSVQPSYVFAKRNTIGIRGLFAATELPKGFIIPFDGEYCHKNTLPTKNTAKKQ